jgi:putative oxidoreductase
MNPNRDLAALVGRILLATLFVVSGIGKIAGFAGTAGYIASKGLPLAEVLAVATIVVEVGGGLALAAGWQARWAALLLAGFTLVASVIFHNFWDAPAAEAMNQRIHFLKNLSIVGGMLVVVAFGPGRLAVGRAAA